MSVRPSVCLSVRLSVCPSVRHVFKICNNLNPTNCNFKMKNKTESIIIKLNHISYTIYVLYLIVKYNLIVKINLAILKWSSTLNTRRHLISQKVQV